MKKIGTAIIIAGGKSSRMGFDKQLIKIGDNYLMDIIIDNLNKTFEEIIVVSNVKSIYSNPNVILVEDEIKNIGPLGGLHVGLKNSTSMYNYVIACDMPYINNEYVKYMMRILRGGRSCFDGLVTRFREWIEPFNCFYSKNILAYMEEYINSGQRSIHSLVRGLNVIYIEEKVARCFSPEWKMFDNLNTREELERYCIEFKGWENKYADLQGHSS